MNEKKGITSTIIIGILLAIVLAYTIFLLPFDLKSLDGNNGNDLGTALGATMVGIIIILLHFGLIIGSIISLICLIFVIRNYKNDRKAIVVTNYIYTFVISFNVIATIVKFVLLFI